MAEPWAKPMIIQPSTTNFKIICQIWWSKTIMYDFYGTFGRIFRVFFHFTQCFHTSSTLLIIKRELIMTGRSLSPLWNQETSGESGELLEMVVNECSKYSILEPRLPVFNIGFSKKGKWSIHSGLGSRIELFGQHQPFCTIPSCFSIPKWV